MISFKNNKVHIFFFLLGFAIIACTNSTKPPPQIKTTPSDSGAAIPLPRNEGNTAVALLDKSPMDVIYYPDEYPKLKMMGTAKTLPVFRVFYSRPQRNGRIIFGTVVKYGENWRLGANEATEIEFFRDVKIQGKKVPKGRYILYCIPKENEWTVILNSDLYSWGLKFDPQKDVFKFPEPVIHNGPPIEAFTMETQESKSGADLWIGWDTSKISLPIAF